MSKVAYLGPEGTFSGILARKKFGAEADLLACSAIEGVFESVIGGRAAKGIVPVENSSGGTVHDTIDLLIRHAGKIFITGELSLDIRIALIGRPGTDIRTVYSHFTQLKHHADWIKDRLPKARHEPVESTAVAAAMAASNPKCAALSPPGAAPLHGLEVLEIPGSSGEVNVTNFFVISRRPVVSQKANRTALSATLKNQCGSLHKFLGPFAREGVSLTRIVSRPMPGQPQTYVFYVEIEGNSEDPVVNRALELAARQASFLKILGSFPVGRRYSS